MEDKQTGSAFIEVPRKFIPYRLLREIGHGSMSTVWEAIDTQTGRRVAIKKLVVPETMAMRERAARMEREARAVARLKHPNIVSIYDVGRENGQPYLAMELLTGQTLRERLHTGPLPMEEAARVLDQAAAAIDAVHAAGVIHRDIKPVNFFLLPDGTVKLRDFGFARQEDDTIVTRADMMVGSPTYMAPEQINDDAVGPAGDVWALGVILYEMLAGRTPFGGEGIATLLKQITTADPHPLLFAAPPVQRVLRRALAKVPARRYASAGALAADFRAALESLPRAAARPHPVPAPVSVASVSSALVSSPIPVAMSASSQRLSVPVRRTLITLAVVILLGMLALAFR